MDMWFGHCRFLIPSHALPWLLLWPDTFPWLSPCQISRGYQDLSAWQAHCGDWLSRYSTRRETAAACGALGLCCRTHRGFLAVDPAVANLSGKSKELEIISLPSYNFIYPHLLLLLLAAWQAGQHQRLLGGANQGAQLSKMIVIFEIFELEY